MIIKRIQEKFRKEVSQYFLKPICTILYKFRFQHLAPDNKQLFINIDDIKAFYRGNRYSEFTFPGIIKAGDWTDRITSKEQKINNDYKYTSVVQRYKQHILWPETDIFKKRYAKQLKKNSQVKGFSDLKELENYYVETYDKIYQSIKEDGVKPATKNNPHIDPIYIIINANGEILYTTDGNHRLFMCFVLGINEIPVKVWMRHTNWQKIRDHILCRNGKNIDLKYSKFLSHPDIKSELKTI